MISLLIIYLLTALNNCIETISINGFSFLEFKKPENIFSTNVAFKDNWILFLSTISLFTISTHLLLIPKSLYFINKLLAWFCNSLFLMILLAYIFKAGNFANRYSPRAPDSLITFFISLMMETGPLLPYFGYMRVIPFQ